MEASHLNWHVYHTVDRQFHVKIFDSCHNALIRNMKTIITETLRATQNMTVKFHSRFADKSLHLHGHVAEAIRKRNLGEARKLMARIVQQAAVDISTLLATNVGHRFLCAVTSKGTAQFIGLTDTLTPMRHLSFLRALTNSLRGPVYLVVSPVALHEDAQVLSVLERNKDRLRLIALPVWLRCGG